MATFGETSSGTNYYDPDQAHPGNLIYSESTFSDGATTPDVSSGIAFVTANTGSTTITNFTNGTDGQEIRVRIDDVNTTIADNANISLLNGENQATNQGEIWSFVLRGTVWYQEGVVVSVASGSSAWTSNTETLTGDKTLLNADAEKQFLDPDGTTRIVSLPALSASNPIFSIVNTGTQGSLLQVRGPNGFSIVSLNNGESGFFVSDTSTYWIEISNDASASGEIAFQYGGDPTLGGYYKSNGISGATNASAANYESEQTSYTGGIIKKISRSSFSSGRQRFKMWINGAISETIRETGDDDTIGISNTFTIISVNDEIAIENDSNISGANPADTTINLLIDNLEILSGSISHGGSTGATAGRYFRSNGEYNQSMNTTLNEDSEINVWDSGNITRLSYNTSNADNTTQFGIWKNQTLSETITLSGVTGSEVASTAVTTGDQIAVEWDSGTDPQFVTTNLGLDIAGQLYTYGAELNLTGRSPQVNGRSTNIQVLPQDFEAESVILQEGVAEHLTYNTNSASTDTDIRLWKNGSISETVTLSGTTGVETLFTLVLERDTISLEYEAGTTPNQSNMQVIVK